LSIEKIISNTQVMKMSDSTQYGWVDYAKGVGIILVVYGHVARGVFNAGMIENEELFRLIDDVIYSFHMPLFFFLSGIFFVKSFTKRGGKNLLISKLDSIVYPYILWSFIQGGFSYSLQAFTNFKTTIVDVLSLLWLPQDQFWFLYVLFLVFVLYVVLYSFLPKVFALFVLSFLMYAFKEDVYFIWALINTTFNFGIYFCAGMLFSRYKGNDVKISYRWVVLVIIAFTLSQFYSYVQFNKTNYVQLMVAFIGIGMVVVISKVLDGRFNILKVAGRSSLEIYLVHVIFGSGFRIVMQHAFNIENSIFHLILGTLVGIFVSLVFAEGVKKIGFYFLFSIHNRGLKQGKV